MLKEIRQMKEDRELLREQMRLISRVFCDGKDLEPFAHSIQAVTQSTTELYDRLRLSVKPFYWFGLGFVTNLLICLSIFLYVSAGDRSNKFC